MTIILGCALALALLALAVAVCLTVQARQDADACRKNRDELALSLKQLEQKAQEELLRERDFLDVLMVNIPDQIYFKDTQSRFIKVNDGVARTLGAKTSAELVGRSDADFFSAEDALAFRTDDTNVIASGKPLLDRIERAICNGVEIWMSTTKIPLFDKKGKPVGLVGISRDITDRKRAEQVLQDVVAHARCILWDARVIESDGNYRWQLKVHSSETTRRAFGLEVQANQTDGEMWVKHIESEELLQMNRTSHAALKNKLEGYQQEFSFVVGDGSRRWLKEDVKITQVTPGVFHLVGVCLDITERKRAEDLLKNVVARAQCILWNAEVQEKEGSLVWDINVVSSDATGCWLGLDKQNRHDGKLWNPRQLEPEQMETMNRLSTESLRNGAKGYSQEFCVRGLDGISRWMAENAEITPQGPGKWNLVGVVMDITERKKAQVALQQIVARARCILWEAHVRNKSGTDTGSGGGWKWDIHMHASDTLRRELGLIPLPGETMGYAWSKLLRGGAPGQLERMDATCTSAMLKGERGYEQEFVLRTMDGGQRWMTEIVEITPLVPDEWHLTAVVTDITERKRAELQLEDERDLLQALMDNVPDNIYFKDLSCRFIRMNQYQARYAGLGDPRDAIGKTDFDFYPEELACEFYTEELEMITTGKGIIGKVERQFVQGQSERWTLTSKVPFRGHDGRILGIVGVSKDITQLKKMEHDLSEANEQLTKLAREDVLTGLLNRRMILTMAETEWARWQRYAKPFSIMLIDADDFKSINDRFGHLTGDQALKMLATRLSQAVRTVDSVGRYGGEEFVVILPETRLEGALVAAQKILQTVREADLQAEGKKVTLTVSIGVATVGADDKALDAVLHRSDMALYAAKRQGKNRVVADEPKVEFEI